MDKKRIFARLAMLSLIVCIGISTYYLRQTQETMRRTAFNQAYSEAFEKGREDALIGIMDSSIDSVTFTRVSPMWCIPPEDPYDIKYARFCGHDGGLESYLLEYMKNTQVTLSCDTRLISPSKLIISHIVIRGTYLRNSPMPSTAELQQHFGYVYNSAVDNYRHSDTTTLGTGMKKWMEFIMNEVSNRYATSLKARYPGQIYISAIPEASSGSENGWTDTDLLKAAGIRSDVSIDSTSDELQYDAIMSAARRHRNNEM